MYLDMPNLLQNILAKNQKISAFPLHEHWVDIGHPDDYRKANIGLE